ncbi:Caffeine resistance [Mycena chlorophos]|uniref:Caffeine resistance n=1 Tax=Mycena chlorophos TaxID=658473 RepID=A0A8H6TP61_MYCCL|nr:Caffeine resistance [Mycena chlorophos]
MVADLFRDAPIGQIINWLSNGRLLPFPEQRLGYEAPRRYLLPAKVVGDAPASDAATLCGGKSEDGSKTLTAPELKRQSTLVAMMDDLEKQQADVDNGPIPDPYLVGWDGDSDPENPRNWTFKKRAFVAFCISFYTFSIYIGSAIYTPSIPGLMVEYDVSLTHATLGLTLYILGYGLGPMFLSPLQELARLGRNPVYLLGLLLFVIFQIPLVTAKNIETPRTRDWGKFFPGASMGDLFPDNQLAYVIGVWALGATAGPITGPVIGSFAAQAKSWRWPMMELIWITSFAFVFLMIFLPETYEPTILLRRAERLRKLTGNPELQTAAERKDASKTPGDLAYEALVRPFILMGEPALAFASIYLGFAFPLVFTDIYHFNLGQSSLPFLAFIYTVYCLYQHYHLKPRIDAIESTGPGVEAPPEIRLEIGLMASIFIPTSILIFGFTSKASINWIVPVIGAGLYLPGIFTIFQSILMYCTMAYKDHAASVLAGNDLFRSSIASVFPLFGRALFVNLGLGPGSAMLAGISFALMPVYWLLLKYGHNLRRRSKYAVSP